MSDKEAQVKLTAKTGELQAGMEQGAQVVEQASAKMKLSFASMMASVKANMTAAQNEVKQSTAAINGSMSSMSGMVSKVTTTFAAMAAVIAGGGAMKKFISDANEWNSSAGKMAKALGITTEQASVLNVALRHVGVESDVYLSASQVLSRQIQSNGQAFQVLGVSVRDASGAYRPVTELMGEVNTKLAAIKNPIAQNIAGQQVYGRGWAEVKSILKVTSETMTEADKRARELGLIVGPEGVAMSKQYSAQMRDLGLVGKSVEVQFGNALLPTFTRLGKFMGEEGPAMGKTFGTVIEGIGFAAMATWLALKDMGDGIGAMAAQAVALASGDLEGFKAIGKARDEEAAKNEAAYERMKANFGKPLPPPKISAPESAGGPTYKFKQKAEGLGAGGAEPSDMPKLEAELAEKKALFTQGQADADTFRQYDKAQELAFWQDKLATVAAGSKDALNIRKRIADLQLSVNKDAFDAEIASLHAQEQEAGANADKRLQIIQREAETVIHAYGAESKEGIAAQEKVTQAVQAAALQRQQIADQISQRKDAQAIADIQAAQEQARIDVELGQMTKAELLQQEQQFEQQMYQIHAQALQQRLTEVDPNNPVQYQQTLTEIQQLEIQHQQRMAAIRGQASVEASGDAMRVGQTLQSGYANVFSQIGTHIRSVGALTRAMGQATLQMFTQMLAQMAAKWVVNKLMMAAIGKTTAVADVTSEAAKAGAGGLASMAAAPFPLNLGAPAFGASMMASALAFVPMASAAGGYDIPGNLDPLVQAHAKEMILPAHIAEPLRESLADGGSGGGGGLVLNGHHLPGGFFAAHQDEFVRFYQTLQKRRFI